MKAIAFGLALLPLLLSACDKHAGVLERLEADAQECRKAVRDGHLQAAHELCHRALGEDAQVTLTPALRSQRLFELARIKRQLSRFDEALRLLQESLAIEESTASPDSLPVLERLLELSLVHAGLAEWQKGAVVLERVLPRAHLLDGKQRKTLDNTVRHYVMRLNGMGLQDSAAKLQVPLTATGQD